MNTKPEIVFNEKLPEDVLKHLNWSTYMETTVEDEDPPQLTGIENNLLLQEALRVLGINLLEWEGFRCLIDSVAFDNALNGSLEFIFYNQTQFNVDVLKDMVERSNLRSIVKYDIDNSEETTNGLILSIVFDAEENTYESRLLDLLHIAESTLYLSSIGEIDGFLDN